MADKIRQLLVKYKEIIVYLIVGVLTTIVSWGACFLMEWLFLGPDLMEGLFLDHDISWWQSAVINTVGWVAGVLFAYPINRKFVFESRNPHILREFSGFAASRISTWLLDVVIMHITVHVMGLHYWIAKLFISSVLVMIANYVFSKVFVFRKKGNREEEIKENER